MKKYILAIVCLPLLWACRNTDDKLNWRSDILAPLIKAELGVKELTGEDSELQVNGDNSVSLVVSDKIYSFSADSLVSLEVTPFIRSFKIDQLQLSDITVSERITMGELLTQAGLPPLNGIPIIITDPDSTIDLSFGPIEADFSDFVQTATLSSGTASISLNNQFPLSIRDLTVEIRNQNSGVLIESIYFARIDKGTTETRTIDLSGKVIEGVLEMYVPNATVEMETFITNINDYLQADIAIQNIEVEEATAIFPAQEIVNNSDAVQLQGLNDAILDEAIIDKGNVRFTIFSTVEEELYLHYEIPSATLNGQQFEVDLVVPPAPVNGQISIDQSYDFDGYHFTFNNNSFDNTVIGRIDSSGIIRTITKEDSVYINLQIEELTPRCIKGYLGQQTINVGPETTALEFLTDVSFTTLNFDQASMGLRLENYIGMDAELNVNQLTATNTTTATSVGLSPLPPPTIVTRAPSNTTGSSTSITLDENNYNTPALVNIIPNQVTYALDINTNPSGNQGNIDFAYKGRGLDAYMDLILPLSVQAEDLSLKDTIDFDINGAVLPYQIEDGGLTFLFENDFPLEGNIKLYFLNYLDLPYDSLVFDKVGAGVVDPSAGKVIVPTETRVKKAFTKEALQRLLFADKLYVKADFDTKPDAQHVKIYDDYTLVLKIIGDFTYHANKPYNP